MAAEDHDATIDIAPATSIKPNLLPILPDPEICVICLDRISGKAIALPCRHVFDFLCLGTWLQQQRRCPLCKGEVNTIKYREGLNGEYTIFQLPAELPQRSVSNIRPERNRYRTWERAGHHGWRTTHQAESGLEDTFLNFRRDVYRNKMYSLHVGTNRISGYRNITPATFVRNEELVSRARKWIRRELMVFDFLGPDSPNVGASDRRASNAEFLNEYIIAILKSIDLKGSTGQAEELLTDFLGRENARLFLHELTAWLRSPYERIHDWDRAVQYASHDKYDVPSSLSDRGENYASQFR